MIPDKYKGRGPLGGLHTCLRSAQNPACLVLSVDVPLIPPENLARLCRAHRGGVTVLRHGTREEPLIGVYDKWIAGSVSALIEAGKYAVQALKETVRWNYCDDPGPEEFLLNCNTPEDFAAAKKIAGE